MAGNGQRGVGWGVIAGLVAIAGVVAAIVALTPSASAPPAAGAEEVAAAPATAAAAPPGPGPAEAAGAAAAGAEAALAAAPQPGVAPAPSAGLEARLAAAPGLLPRPRLDPAGQPAEARGAEIAQAGEPEGAAAAGEGQGDAPGLVYAADAAGIRAAMAEAKASIRECYDAWIKARPELAGTLKVTFVIAQPEGEPEAGREDERLARVTRVKIAGSTLDHGLLEGCVANVTAGLAFDPPDGGELTVTYPFAFSAEGPPAE